jgi:hypothetical protein
MLHNGVLDQMFPVKSLFIPFPTRHIVRAIGASSFRKGEAPQVGEEGVPLMIRQTSSRSESGPEGKEKKKKRSLFGSK